MNKLKKPVKTDKTLQMVDSIKGFGVIDENAL